MVRWEGVPQPAGDGDGDRRAATEDPGDPSQVEGGWRRRTRPDIRGPPVPDVERQRVDRSWSVLDPVQCRFMCTTLSGRLEPPLCLSQTSGRSHRYARRVYQEYLLYLPSGTLRNWTQGWVGDFPVSLDVSHRGRDLTSQRSLHFRDPPRTSGATDPLGDDLLPYGH